MNTERFILSDAKGGKIGELVFREEGDVLIIARIEVALAYRHRGYAGKLMRQIVGKARAEGKKLRPDCPYAAYWLGEHPEHDGMVLREKTGQGE